MTEGQALEVRHPETGESHTITVPADHDGSRIKVEFPDGVITYTEGFDPAERALGVSSAPPNAELHTSSDDAAAASDVG